MPRLRTANISRRRLWQFLEAQGVLQVTRDIVVERVKGGAKRLVRGHCEMDLITINKNTLELINPRVHDEVGQKQNRADVEETKPAYFLTVIEVLTGYALIAFCPDKSARVVRNRLKPLLKRLRTALGAPILSMTSDHGREFIKHVTQLFEEWDPPIKQRMVQRASRVEKYNADFQRAFYRNVRLKRGGLPSCSKQAEKQSNELLSKNVHCTPSEALEKTDAELADKHKATREERKAYHDKRPVEVGTKCRYLVKMRKNIRKVGYKTYKAKHYTAGVFTVRALDKLVPPRYYVNGAWRDRDELLLVSNVDVTTQQKIDQRDY